MQHAITADQLAKCYRISHAGGAVRAPYQTLRETLANLITAPLRRIRNPSLYGSVEDFWALRDVSFEVNPGEVVGIIGRNGAGKSTLLKILTQITEPTRGEAVLRGRVGSLLEVGTGFHPELTGRENIFLNGSILGMNRGEIRREFNRIVDFSGVEQFLDTPVKRYSSGMKVRLAFAVAAFLQPEILLIDEVLAVGDAEFQARCLGKMQDVANSGRTVLFVSHNLGAVASLCTRCMYLDQGRLKSDGMPGTVIGEYLAAGSIDGEADLRSRSPDRTGDGPLRVEWVATSGDDDRPRAQFGYGEPMQFRARVRGKPGQAFNLEFSIRSSMSQMVLHFSTVESQTPLVLSEELAEVRLAMPRNLLTDGRYFISVWLGDARAQRIERVENCLAFDVDSSAQGMQPGKGCVRLPGTWHIEATPA